jgi:predicted TIM-barrel fold metal-dependent hydrolase
MEIDAPNRWRLETPGYDGWARSARPSDPKKYFMVSSDSHVNEPHDLWVTRIDTKYRDRLPRLEVDAQGVQWQVLEGMRRVRLREYVFHGEDLLRRSSGADPEQRLKDMARDGVDAEILFPNKGLGIWATPDADFSRAQCRVWNDWAWETFARYNDRMSPMAAIATGEVEPAIAEIERCAKLGFRGLALPVKPVFGPHDARHPNYNLAVYDPMWAAIQDTGLPITFHISTGTDPRAARAEGGAIVNLIVHSIVHAIEPVVNLCASGVFDRFPKLRFAAIECGIGWVAWTLQAMDEAYRKHHMWIAPKLKMLPSEYFRQHGYCSFQEDEVGIDDARRYDLVDNFLWANDYPHQEGSWPHSSEAIERQMGSLSDAQRAKILGLNGAKLFGFEVPKDYPRAL